MKGEKMEETFAITIPGKNLSAAIPNKNLRPHNKRAKEFTIRDQIWAVGRYLPYEDMRTLQELDRKWLKEKAAPCLARSSERVEEVLKHIKNEIVDTLLYRTWTSEKTGYNDEETKYCVSTAIDRQDLKDLDTMWWCYRELNMAFRRIYSYHEKYC